MPRLLVTGELTLATGYAQSSGSGVSERQFAPWTLTGNITLATRSGWVVPVGIVGRSRSDGYGQTTNQIGVSPQYRNWLTLHGGYCSVYFSPLTLAGSPFLGTGVELNRGLLRVGAIYGQFSRAVEANQTDQVSSFRRTGYGLRAGIGGAQNYLDVILLNVADDPHSIRTNEETGLTPAENRALGVSGRLRLRKTLYVEFDAAGSAYTSDVRTAMATSAKADGSGRFYVNLLSKLTPLRVSTQLRTALQTALTYKMGLLAMKLDYKRIEPDYQTMGTYYVQNDIERLTATPSVRCFNKRLMLRGSVGFQHNNLLGQKKNRTDRLTHSFNASYTTDDNLTTLDLTYSNYGLSQRAGYRPLNDTTRLAQTTRTLSANGFRMWMGETRMQTLTASAMYQELCDLNPFTANFSQNQNWYYSVSYGYRHLTTGLDVNLSYAYSLTKATDTRSVYTGPSVSMHQKLLKNRFSLDLGGSFLSNRENGTELNQTGTVLNGSAGIAYQPTPVHRLSFNWTVSCIRGLQSGSSQQGEFQYSVSF